MVAESLPSVLLGSFDSSAVSLFESIVFGAVSTKECWQYASVFEMEVLRKRPGVLGPIYNLESTCRVGSLDHLDLRFCDWSTPVACCAA